MCRWSRSNVLTRSRYKSPNPPTRNPYHAPIPTISSDTHTPPKHAAHKPIGRLPLTYLTLSLPYFTSLTHLHPVINRSPSGSRTTNPSSLPSCPVQSSPPHLTSLPPPAVKPTDVHPADAFQRHALVALQLLQGRSALWDPPSLQCSRSAKFSCANGASGVRARG